MPCKVSISLTAKWKWLLVTSSFQGVRRASYLDVSEARADGAQGGAGVLGGGRSRRASVCMAAEALMAGIKDKDSSASSSTREATR